ncbi:MAG: NAD(P)-dependent oxidoreductase [Bacteroidetes bacterium]|nr:NAD(P)-dependent oxidoreductase [Bacteroidota bacterium]MDA1119617.1 NAD(P)-dependent oxidoreductase [Bacteroidota bacterium]
MKKLLITGATGLVGSHLIKELCLLDYDLFAVSQHPDKLPKNVKPINIDFTKDWSTDSLPKNINYIIHLAQSESFRNFPEKAEDIFMVNTVSTLKLADYAKKNGAEKFIYSSSGGIYGTGDHNHSEDKDIAFQPSLGFYLTSKYCSEILLNNYKELFNVVCLRLFFVYGKGQKRTMLMPRLFDSVKNNIPITLQGQDGISLRPTHVSDVVAAIVKTLDFVGSDTINIAGPEILSIKDIALTAGQFLKRDPLFLNKLEMSDNILCDISKMEKVLCPPKIKFLQGVQDLA